MKSLFLKILVLGRGREAGWAFKASALGLRDSRIDSGIPGLRDRLQDSRPPSDSRTPGLRDRLRDSRVPGFQDSRTSKNIAFSKVFQGFGVGPARRPEGAKTLVFLGFFNVSVARGAWAPGRAQGPREVWSPLGEPRSGELGEGSVRVQAQVLVQVLV